MLVSRQVLRLAESRLDYRSRILACDCTLNANAKRCSYIVRRITRSPPLCPLASSSPSSCPWRSRKRISVAFISASRVGTAGRKQSSCGGAGWQPPGVGARDLRRVSIAYQRTLNAPYEEIRAGPCQFPWQVTSAVSLALPPPSEGARRPGAGEGAPSASAVYPTRVG